MEQSEAPHRWVADKIGYSVSGVSLLRSGKRKPTLHTMEAVERAFGWSVAEQAALRNDYTKYLEANIERAYQNELEQKSNTKEEQK